MGHQVDRAEAALVQRIEALDTRLTSIARAANDGAKEDEHRAAAAKDELREALDHAKALLAGAAAASGTELADNLEAARATLDQTADGRVNGLEDKAGTLRDQIEVLNRDLAAALEEKGRDQAAAVDRAAAAWMRRIEQTGRRRTRTSWRRTGPGAIAAVLAIAAAFGATLLVRGGGNDRNSVANASQPESPPAAPAPPSPQSSAPSPFGLQAIADPTLPPPSDGTAAAVVGNRQTGASPRGVAPVVGATSVSGSTTDSQSSTMSATESSPPPPQLGPQAAAAATSAPPPTTSKGKQGESHRPPFPGKGKANGR